MRNMTWLAAVLLCGCAGWHYTPPSHPFLHTGTNDAVYENDRVHYHERGTTLSISFLNEHEKQDEQSLEVRRMVRHAFSSRGFNLVSETAPRDIRITVQLSLSSIFGWESAEMKIKVQGRNSEGDTIKRWYQGDHSLPFLSEQEVTEAAVEEALEHLRADEELVQFLKR